LLKLALGCQTPTYTPLPHLGGYAEIAKWLFTLLTSQADTGYAHPFFSDQTLDILFWVKIFVS